MYESQEEMAEFFEFYSEKEVRDYIKILVDKGLLVKDNFKIITLKKRIGILYSDNVFQKVFSKRQIRRIEPDPAVPSEETDSSDVHILDKEEEKTTIPKKAKSNSKFDDYDESSSNFLKSLNIGKHVLYNLMELHGPAKITQAIKRALKWKGRPNDDAGFLTDSRPIAGMM